MKTQKKFFTEFSSIPTLKSPMKMKLSWVLVCSSMTWFKNSRWLETEFLWGLCEQFKNHFLFFKLISTKKLSILHWDFGCNKRDGMSSLICNRRPPPLSFLSYLYGMVKPILNWAEGNKSSFVSEIRKMSMFFSSIYIKDTHREKAP